MLQRVVYVDCDGNPQNHVNTELADRPCVQELSYKKSGLSYIDCKDATLKTLYIMHFSTDKLGVDLKDENENQAANFLSSTTSVDQGASILQQSHFLDRIMKSPSKISRYIYERDEDGYIVKKCIADIMEITMMLVWMPMVFRDLNMKEILFIVLLEFIF